jgi:hypothetical protein
MKPTACLLASLALVVAVGCGGGSPLSGGDGGPDSGNSGTAGSTGAAGHGTAGSTGAAGHGTAGTTGAAGEGTAGTTGAAGHGTAGTTGAAGGGTAGSTGAAGHGTSGTTGHDGGAPDSGSSCTDLQTQYGEALAAARTCTVGAANQCAQAASSWLSPCFSNCLTYVDDASALNQIKSAWVAAGCANQGPIACPAIACIQPLMGNCVATDGGGGVCSSIGIQPLGVSTN